MNNSRIFWFSSVPGANPVPQLSLHKSNPERAGLSGVLSHLSSQVRPPLLIEYLAQEGPPGANRAQEWRSRWEQDPSRLHPCSGGNPVPQLSVPKSHQEKAGHPGVLTWNHSSPYQILPGESALQKLLKHIWSLVHRLTGGTSPSQRQQDKLTPVISRCQEARGST